ncbi:MAG TPA: phytanoyl-CoA dioxygenase family protein [Allosphingosinicella sp.]|nr:phytanoyl-CoA dioxygenase family protein [Allosphingosinicella sp.]
MTLTPTEISAFIRDGYVAVPRAFPRELAERCRAILWQALGLDPGRPETWTRPVVRLDRFAGPFAEAANTERLTRAYDQLVGPGRWLPPGALGTFPVRFPSDADPGDAGWHIDVSFGTETPDFMQWRANICSKGRALLMLFLFSDVGPDDAPTRLRAGSHRDIARRLAPAGEAGLTLGELAANDFDESAQREERVATGLAGTVFLCHPFLVHAAQPHRGTRPRFMAQPPLLPREPLQLERADGDHAPVEIAIREALGLA